MKKKQLKLIAALAYPLPVIIDNKAGYLRIAGAYDKSGRRKYQQMIGIQVNHRRRLKRRFIQGGVSAMETYLKQVEEHQEHNRATIAQKK